MERCGVFFPLLINYRFPVKCGSLDYCALLNSWLIVECSTHLRFVDRCEIICLQDSISSWLAAGVRECPQCLSPSYYEQGYPPTLHEPRFVATAAKRCLLPLVNITPWLLVFLLPLPSPMSLSLLEAELSLGSLTLQNVIFLLGSSKSFTSIILFIIYWPWD